MNESHERALFDAEYKKALKDNKLMFAGSLLQYAARNYPDRIALFSGKQSITFAQLYQRSLVITRKLIAADVKPRDRVCLLFENSIEFFIGYYGIWQTGAILAPLNTFLHERELNHIISDAKPTAIVVSKKLLDGLKEKVSIMLTEDDMHEAPSSDQGYVIPDFDPNELALLLYTSGTTGEPKGVMLSSTNILMGMLQVLPRITITQSERIFGILPLFHSFAQVTCVWGPFFVGAAVIVVPRIERHIIRDHLEYKPTVFLGVPGLYGILCLFRNLNLDSVNYFVCGGDALPDKIRAAFELVYRRKLCNGYGLTEASPVVSAELDDRLVSTNCIGRPVYGVQVAIRDEDGKDLGIGHTGRLWVKGANVMLGYYNAPEHTAKVIKDGWLDTGDLAMIDTDGRIYMCGRLKDLIIHKGFNIYPQEIENVILSHPAVTSVGVVGKPDDEYGQIPIAFVAVRHKTETIEQELYELCKRDLAPYKIPKQFIILESLPLTPIGKVDKKVLIAQYLTKK